ncbi:aldolase [Paenibacillus radicis (ex Gao et al. 2016)]|uniref:Aldolase n=1 Tax=Paenibacillus radicis (ex Gao et al. 2016) TaxID=1737354 RepID=A0A917M5N2_9BACL|nr:aldolase [Paenibacillus radicis (ex Gao et al. 2016)]GGG76496.1 hypothetical protein GCM10010918_36270 [Paenibacillus radicis (ex Gao et al. 2016)]
MMDGRTGIDKRHYLAFGLRIASDFELPELLSVNEPDFEPDFIVEWADLTALRNELDPDRPFAVKGNEMVLGLDKAATYRITGGSRIQMMPAEGADPRDYRIYLLGLGFAFALFQRGAIPLHGSAVVIEGRAYAFVGECGAGKSTLAAAFLRQGYKLLSDDIVPVTLGAGENGPVAHPGFPQQKLWQESLDFFQMNAAHFNPIGDDYEKYAIPVADQFHQESMPLAALFELEAAEDSETVELKPLSKLERMQLLYMHTYSGALLTKLDLRPWHFQMSSTIASQVDCYRLKRPKHGFTADLLVNEILNVAMKGELVQ